MNDNDFKIAQQIAELRGVVVEGFKGVHARQDTANGRIGKCEMRLEKLENSDSFERGKSVGISTFWKIVVAVLTFIIALMGIAVQTGCWGLFCKN